MKKYNFIKGQLEELYWGKNKSQQEIANIYNCCQYTISHFMILNNIKRKRHGWQNISKPIKLNNEEKDIIDGLIMGDGYLKHDKNKNSRLELESKNKEFCRFIKNRLKNIKFGKISDRKRYLKITNKYYRTYSIYTVASPTFTKLRAKWYPSGIKSIPQNLKISKTNLLLLYLSDGHLHKRDNVIKISTNCFSKKEQSQILIPQLNKLGFEARLHKQENQYIIYIPHRNVQKFLDYIGPCPIKCFEYKFNHQIKENLNG